MGSIIWLASYPKSGNTWVRALLTNYLRNCSQPAAINDLDGGVLATQRQHFDELVGVEASDLSGDDIARYRCEAYRHLAGDSDGHILIKVHDAYHRGTIALFPGDVTTLAIYVIRNPLDVAVSLAYHLQEAVTHSVDRICDGFVQSASVDRLHLRLEQSLLSWSAHARSWIDDSGVRVHIVRFEDLVTQPQSIFLQVLDAIGEPVDAERAARSVQFSSFDELRSQEEAGGFKERPPGMPAFFRRGRIGDWRSTLTTEQAARIIRVHGDMMRRFHYLSRDGDLLC